MKNKMNIKVVFGSWKAYTENNERAMGSKWLDMSDYDSVDEIYDEMKKEGFTEQELEETFIQDIEADYDILKGQCDSTNIERLYEYVEMIDNSDNEVEAIGAYLEKVNDDIEEACNADLYWYDGQTIEDVAYNIVKECYDLPEIAERYFNYEAFGRDLELDGNYYETFNGVLEVR